VGFLKTEPMPTSIITTDDLYEFKLQLLKELKKLLKEHKERKLKKYLKSSEVMELLQISPGTLQHLRNNGTLPYVKIKGLIYYQASDIQKVMDKYRVHHSSGFAK
tara:strand:- start:63576 stop:63890 length:315 start_codon:yes stop_codon:yes gene_type:complete